MIATTRLALLLLVTTLLADRVFAQPEAPEAPTVPELFVEPEVPDTGETEFNFDDDLNMDEFDTGEFDIEIEGFDPNDFSSEPSPAQLAIGLACYGAFFLVLLAVWIGILLLFSKALGTLPEEHRLMSPGQVWLVLIPLFNLVWIFFVFTRIPKSFRSYFSSIGRTDVGDCGEQIGLWYCICVVSSIIPCIGMIPALAALVLLIIFIVKIVDLKNKVQAPGPAGLV